MPKGAVGTYRLPWTEDQVTAATPCATCKGAGVVNGPRTQVARLEFEEARRRREEQARQTLVQLATRVGKRRRTANTALASYGHEVDLEILNSTAAELAALIERGRHFRIPPVELLKAAGLTKQALSYAKQRIKERGYQPDTASIEAEMPEVEDNVIELLDECTTCHGDGADLAARILLMDAADLGRRRRIAAAQRDQAVIDTNTRALWSLVQRAHEDGISAVKVAEAAGLAAPAIYDAHRRLEARTG